MKVIEKLDGTVLLRSGAGPPVWREVKGRPGKPKAARKAVTNNKPWKPAAGHPSDVG